LDGDSLKYVLKLNRLQLKSFLNPIFFGLFEWFHAFFFTCGVTPLLIRVHSGDFRFKNVFGRRTRWKPALRSRILFASTEVMLIPRSDSSLHFDIMNTHQFVRKNQMLALGVCFSARAMAAGLPRQDDI